ncbi:MAG TPA: hypothetical protein VNO30_49635 [Kofleriaceae bacterium]|nr:hypothetical protein [Kofleriaceae bacterium]
MIRKLSLVLLLSGCFSIPPYAPEEAVTFTAADTGGVVAGKIASGLPFELEFPGVGGGIGFPNALRINGTDVLGHDPGQACNQEDEVGILFSPAPRISASGGAPPVTSLLSPVLPGPAVVQMKLDWATRLACNSERSPGGTSTFTVFPDGRIVRHDTITDPSSADISLSQCTCAGPSSGFNIATFWTIARGAFSKLRHSGLPDDVLQLPTIGEELPNYGWSCVDDGTRQMSFVWSKNEGVRIRGRDQLIGFGFEFRLLNDQTPGTLSLENDSVIFIGRSAGCMDTEARADDYIDPLELKVNGVAMKPSLRDGIYGGDAGDGAPPGVELAEGDHFELTGQVRNPYAVWLRFPRAVDALRAVRVGATGVWYVPQRVDDRSWILFFKEPLASGQTITVEPI